MECTWFQIFSFNYLHCLLVLDYLHCQKLFDEAVQVSRDSNIFRSFLFLLKLFAFLLCMLLIGTPFTRIWMYKPKVKLIINYPFCNKINHILQSILRQGKYDRTINYLLVFKTIWMNRNEELFFLVNGKMIFFPLIFSTQNLIRLVPIFMCGRWQYLLCILTR